MTKEREEFLKNYGDRQWFDFEAELQSVINAEIEASKKPKPVFEKPFKINVEYPFNDKYYRIFDVNGKMVGWTDDNKAAADFICAALNSYDPE